MCKVIPRDRALDSYDIRVIDYLTTLLAPTGQLPDDDLERWLWIAHAWVDWKREPCRIAMTPTTF